MKNKKQCNANNHKSRVQTKMLSAEYFAENFGLILGTLGLAKDSSY